VDLDGRTVDAPRFRQSGASCRKCRRTRQSLSMQADTDDIIFEPRLGLAGHDKGASLPKVRAAIRIAGRIAPSNSRATRTGMRGHFAKGSAGKARPISTAQRRVVVKARYVSQGGGRGAPLRVHVAYLAREAKATAHPAQEVPESDHARELGKSVDYLSRESDAAVGRLPFYNQRESDLDAKTLTSEWGDDTRHFRLIIGAEDGAMLGDLRPFIREVMAGLEAKTGARLQWIAVDHHDTDNPHSHVLIRGRRADGQDLFIPSQLITSGIREHAQDIVTRVLGPRQNVDLVREHDRDINLRGLSPLDRELIKQLDASRHLRTDRPDLIARLQCLEGWDLANRTSGGWRLADDLTGKLKALEARAEVERAVGLSRRGRALGELRAADPSTPAIGELVHFGPIDELGETFLVVVENGKGEFRYATFEHADDLARLGGVVVGAIMAFEPRDIRVRPSDETVARIASRTGGVYSIEHHAAAEPGASRAIMAANVRRLEAMRRAGLVARRTDAVFAIAADHLHRALAFERKLAKRAPLNALVQSYWTLSEQVEALGPTRLDRILSGATPPVTGEGRFARAEASAVQQRRLFLIEQGVMGSGDRELSRSALATMAQRELSEAARRVSKELGAPVLTHRHTTVRGVYAQRLDLAQGRVAVILQERQAFIAPWRPALERFAGREVEGVMHGQTLSWSLDRKLGPGLPPM